MSATNQRVAPEPPATPDPLREEPPADRFCDLVLNGGVASGVVYPWAVLELARHYRFKSIGGNSVGAMAAAMAAAAEYGRCNGVENAFEPLRQFPLKLAEEKSGKTRMLRLFQPSPPVRRLFKLFLALVHHDNPEKDRSALEQAAPEEAGAETPRRVTRKGLLLRVLGMYWVALLPLFLLPLVVWIACEAGWTRPIAILAVAACLGAVLVALLIGALLFYLDLGALARNDYGLCTGRSQEPGEEGLVEWLHRGIQLSAGRKEDDPLLTFADLWAAPRFGQAGPGPLPGGLQPPDPGIDLQMFASNITQGRPVRLPLNDANTRLYYLPEEWEAYFPDYVMKALKQASKPYVPASRSDPDPATFAPDDPQVKLMGELRELPSGGMPIVVAARLSMCFPVLFSSVRVYAVDYETLRTKRRLRRCLLSDGGLCTNFPIHLFDAAHPRWPTFAFLLDNRLKTLNTGPVWRPDLHLEGRADNWLRFVPGAEDEDDENRRLVKRLLGFVRSVLGVEDKDEEKRCLVKRLFGFAGGLIVTMKDWNDRVTGRLPQVRNRIIRLALQDGEGQLNIGMLPVTILRMAHVYGTAAGNMLVDSFAPEGNGAKEAWREHVYLRSIIELRALRQHLRGYTRAVESAGSTVPLREVLDAATKREPLREGKDRPDPTAARLTDAQRQALDRAVQAVQALEAELSACEDQFGPYRPVLEPELRLRPPV